MLTVGDKLPEFSLKACISRDPGREFATITHESFPGKWLVLFFWPLDFSPLCPTELEEFSAQHEQFASRNAVVLGASLDSKYAHLNWKNTDPRLKDVNFPLLSDVKRELTSALGILHKSEGVPLRATFLIDPEGVIRFACANDLPTGRSVPEIIRSLDALQTGEPCPVNWQKGQKTLS
ncbi:MAG TPA: peroxiredoxin [Oligoflexia bacterium]|nr:peroxiredoxin [Oligoflexia bacterium]